MINSWTPHYVFKSFYCSIKSVMLIIIITTNYKLQNVILNCKPCWLTNSILKWSRISGLSFHLFLLLSSFHLSQVLKGHREKRGERRVQLKNKKTTKKKNTRPMCILEFLVEMTAQMSYTNGAGHVSYPEFTKHIPQGFCQKEAMLPN